MVTQTLYNDRGEAYITIDPAGKAFRVDSDEAGRQILTTDNYVCPGPCETCGATDPCNCPLPLSSAGAAAYSPLAPGGRGAGGEGVCLQAGNDQNVIVETTYNADNLVLTVTAKNPVTGDQTTRYEYGTTLADSAIARNDLRVAEIYPDATDSADRVTFTYNRQAQRTTKTDQNGSVHGYSYDLLGRPTSDAITVLATNIDDTVLRIDTAYEIHGQPFQITSYADAAGTSVVNQIQRAYNNFQQLATEYQEHNGAVNTGTSVKVQYAYANGAANTIRRTGVTYPNGRTVNYLYNSGDDNALSRVSSFNDGAPLVAYTYLGLVSIVEVTYPTPDVSYLLSTAGGTNPYTGLDTFGRVIEALWTKGFFSSSSSSRSSSSSSSGASAALVDIGYGYLCKKQPVGGRIFRFVGSYGLAV